MPSLNLDLDFFEHPKVKRLRSLIGSEAEIFLIRLWAYAGIYHARDGFFKDYSSKEIETVVNWSGKSEAMLKAFVNVGFLKKSKNAINLF